MKRSTRSAFRRRGAAREALGPPDDTFRKSTRTWLQWVRALRAAVSLVAAGILVANCSDLRPTSPATTQSRAPLAAGTATVPSSSGPSVIWLAPLAATSADAPAQDISVAATVEVCEWSAGACKGAPIVRFTPAGSPQLRVDAQGFSVDWSITSTTLLTRKTYRIRAMMNGVESGGVLVDVVRGRWALTRTDGTLAPLASASAIPIRFIAVAAAAAATIDPAGGTFEMTVPATGATGPVRVALTVPAGAVTSPTVFRISTDGETVPETLAGASLILPTLRLEPSGVTFATPVQVVVTLPSPIQLPETDVGTSVSAQHWSVAGVPGASLPVHVSADKTTLTVDVPHFSWLTFLQSAPPALTTNSQGFQTMRFRWAMPTVSWYLSLPSNDYIDEGMVRDAMTTWQTHTYGFMFVQAASASSANILITAMPGDPTQVEPCPGQGVSTTVTHGAACVPAVLTQSSVDLLRATDRLVVVLNASPSDADRLTKNQMIRVITHQLGHALGLYHPTDGTANFAGRGDVMDAQLRFQLFSYLEAAPGDTLGVQSTYGQRSCGVSANRTGLEPARATVVLALDDARCRATSGVIRNLTLRNQLSLALSRLIASYELAAPVFTIRRTMVANLLNPALSSTLQRPDWPDLAAMSLAFKTAPTAP